MKKTMLKKISVYFRNMQLAKKMIFVYAVFLGIIVLITTGALQISLGIYDEKLYEKSLQELDFFSQKVNDSLQDVENLSYSIAMDTEIQEQLAKLDGLNELSAEYSYEMYVFRSMLINELYSHEIIKNITYTDRDNTTFTVGEDTGSINEMEYGQLLEDMAAGRGAYVEYPPTEDYPYMVSGRDILESLNASLDYLGSLIFVSDVSGLIRAAREEFPSVEFIVLSGYGEYEYTSQAMELGVRHYVLKPCDEERISEILRKVEAEIEKKRGQRQKMEDYRQTVEQLLPRAREQILRNLLLERETLNEEGRRFLKEIGAAVEPLRLLGFRAEKGFDELEQFILENVLKELLGGHSVLKSVCIDEEVVFLLKEQDTDILRKAAKRIYTELAPFAKRGLLAAASAGGSAEDLGRLYIEMEDLFQMGYMFPEGSLISRENFGENAGEMEALIDCYRIQKADSFEEILFEVYLMYLKMKAENLSREKMEEVCRGGAQMLGTAGLEDGRLPEETGRIVEILTGQIAEKNLTGQPEAEEERMRRILLAIYQNLGSQNLSIQYLSKEILYMNEEYFGRLFSRHMKEKFSSFLLNRRIALAKRLMLYRPDIRLSQLAEIVGYAPDGQYFSKAFRKVTDMSPTEYKEKIKKGELSEEG